MAVHLWLITAGNLFVGGWSERRTETPPVNTQVELIAAASEPEPPPPPVVRPPPRHVPIAKTPQVEGIPNPKPSQAQPLPPEPPSLPAAKPQDSMASGPVSSTPPGPGDMVSPIPATGGGLGPGSSTGQANYGASDTGTTLASKGNASFTSAAPDYLHNPPPEYPEEASGDANPLADETHAAAVPAYQPRHYPFDGGEKAVYHASWNGILSMATAEIRTTPQWIDGKKFYSVRVEARTSKLLDLIWKMRDTITSTIEAEGLMPTRFTFSQRENQKVIDTVAHFDRATKKWSVHRDEKGKVKQYEFDQPTNTVDPITAIYLARSQDFKVGDHLFFHIFGGKYRYLLDLEVECRETVRTKSGDVEAFKIVPRIKNVENEGYAQRLNEAAIWISADNRRLPIMMSSKIVFGSIYVEMVPESSDGESTTVKPVKASP